MLSRVRPGTAAVAALVAVAAVASPALSAPAVAASPTLTVDPRDGLVRSGQSVTVTGSGFDESKGIYVALCRDNGPGRTPTPCAGGTGAAASSIWISSNPPEYGVGLAVPYEPGGSFTAQLWVVGEFTLAGTTYDCAVIACAIVSRADHTRPDARSQDVRVPVSFAATATPPSDSAGGRLWWAVGGVVLVLLGSVLIGLRMRKPS